MREAGYGFFLPHFLSRLSPSTQEKNTWDDSELEQSGLHSAVRFLSAVLALRASLIPAFFLFFLSACSFIVVSVLFIWVYFSLRPGCKADPNEISFTLKSIRNGPIIPTTSIRGGFPPPGPKHTGWCDYPKSKFFFFFTFFVFDTCSEFFFPLWSTGRFCLWAWIQTTQSWQLHREILMIRAMIIPVN